MNYEEFKKIAPNITVQTTCCCRRLDFDKSDIKNIKCSNCGLGRLTEIQWVHMKRYTRENNNIFDDAVWDDFDKIIDRRMYYENTKKNKVNIF